MSTAPAAPTSERDEKGRFAPGNSGGPGNPFARQVAALRQALLNALTPDKMAEIAAALIAKAAEGNVQAAKLLFSHALGKPADAVNPDRLDVEEWEGYKETAGIMQEAPKLVNAIEPRFPLALARAMRPGVTDIAFEKLGTVLDDPSKRYEIFPSPAGPDLPPSPNGFDGWVPPLTNGKKRRPAPSPNGNVGESRGTRGASALHSPSPNGQNGVPAAAGAAPNGSHR